MKRIYQTRDSDLENGVYGNCLQACVASLFELPLEEVPDSPDGRDFRPFLKERFNLNIDLRQGYPDYDGKLYIVSYKVAGVPSEKCCHCVIWRNGRVVHNPKRTAHRLWRADHYFVFENLSYQRLTSSSVSCSQRRSVLQLTRKS